MVWRESENEKIYNEQYKVCLMVCQEITAGSAIEKFSLGAEGSV